MTHAVLVPAQVLGCLEDIGQLVRPLWLAQTTDVSLDRRACEQWLIVNPESLSVVERAALERVGGETAGEESRHIRSVAWSDIKRIRTQAGIGGGTLQILTADGWNDLLRFSNAYSTRYHKITRLLELMREHPEDWQYREEATTASNDEDEHGFDAPECPTCNLRLQSSQQPCPRCVQKGQILRRVGQLIQPHRRSAILLCLLTIAGVGAELIPPKLQQYMIDHVLAERVPGITTDTGLATEPAVDFRTALLWVVLALATSRVLLSVVGVVKGQLATVIGTGLTSMLRMQMVRKLQSLAIVYYDRHQVGSMVSRVAHDSEAMHGLMHQLTGGFLLQIAQLIGVGAMLLWINPKLAMYTLIPVPLVILGTWIFWKKVYPRYYRLWDSSAKQITMLSGMLSGIRVVKAFAQENREYQRFENASEQLRSWRLWVEKTNAWYGASMGLIFSLGGLIVWYVGGRDVIGRTMTLGELIAFLAYLGMFYAPLSALSNFTSWLTSFWTGTKRVMELLDTPQTVIENLQPHAWPEPRGEIAFENVTFGYDRNQPVLKNISFQVQAGEMVGIVGRSGSGKSTMVNLMGRFYDVHEGRITIDGIDIRQLSTQDLRTRMGIVFQESFLFRGTIWRNLSFGTPDASRDQGLSAAKAAGAHDFICRQPLAYETLLGEHGAGLSGGEKQRLSIARTLLYDPKILVLDEATSNIDAEAEKSIQEALQQLIRGRTTIAIAHRLSTLRHADRILVFDQGQLIEQGTHAQLLAADGTYARLVRIQTSVSKDPSVDLLMSESVVRQRLIHESANEGKSSPDRGTSNASVALLEPDKAQDSEPPQPDQPANDAASIRWLQPLEARFEAAADGRLELWIAGERLAANVFVTCCFPASAPRQLLSIRTWSEQGEESELGMIHDLNDWPSQDRELLDAAIARRYLLKMIRRVYRARLQLGYLDLDVETNLGSERFTMRWTQSQAIDFGENGKLLIDSKENRYVVADIDELPAADRERFLQYVYW